MTEANHHSAATAELSGDCSTLTVSIPLTLRRHAGRKRMINPTGDPGWKPPGPQFDSTLVKALARAFRWKRLLEDGMYGSIVELAAAERINEAYVRRILRLTLLAPAIVENILDGRPVGMGLEDLRSEFPADWEAQRAILWPTLGG